MNFEYKFVDIYKQKSAEYITKLLDSKLRLWYDVIVKSEVQSEK